jgi:hypothetical protein
VNDRERALLAYVVTIANHVRGFSSPDDLVNRVMRCVRQDAVFIAENAAMTLVEGGKRVLERGAYNIGESIGRSAERAVRDIFKKVGR